LLLPNVISFTAIFYSLVVFTKRIVAAYFGIFFIIGFFVGTAVVYKNNIDLRETIFLFEPSAFSIIENAVNVMSTNEKNFSYLPLEGVLLYNRLLWLSISLLLFGASYIVFRYRTFIAKPSEKRVRASEPVVSSIGDAIPIAKKLFSVGEWLRKTFRLAWLEFKTVIRPGHVIATLIMLFAFYFLYNALWTQEYYSTTSMLPLTKQMTRVRLPLGIFVITLLMLYSGELLFRERTAQYWQIADTLPTPSWVTLLSKFLAMALFSFVLATMMMLSGVVAQVAQGFYDIEWDLYIYDCYIDSYINYLQAVALAFFVGTIFPNRIAAHGISVGIFLFSIIAHELELIEQTQFLYLFEPEHDYSDLNGHGSYVAANTWFKIYWSSLAAFFLCVAAVFINRGVEKSIVARLRSTRISGVAWTSMAVLLSLFIGSGYVIYDNVNRQSRNVSKAEERAEKAEYEKKYSHVQRVPQPKITSLNLHVDLFPSERAAKYRFEMHLKNKTTLPIDSLHLEYKEFSSLDSLWIDHVAAAPNYRDEDLRCLVYKLPRTLLPNDSLTLSAAMTLRYTGFADHEAHPDLTFNGTFLSTDILPHIGYDHTRELTENKYRTEFGLTPILSRKPEIEHPLAKMNTLASANADFLDFQITVSTDADQLPVTAGRLVQSSIGNDGRVSRQYVSEKPGLLNFYIASARYQTQKTMTTLASGKQIEIEVYYHHPYCVPQFLSGVKNGLAYCEKIFGDYPYESVRVIETPMYDEEFKSFANVIALPETHGWASDAKSATNVDYITYITGKQLASHWWGNDLAPRATQGSEMLAKSLSEYAALSLFATDYGKNQTKEHLKRKIDAYFKGRAAEANQEPILMTTDGAGYVDNDKGGVVMFALSERVGKTAFDAALRTYLDSARRNQTPPFTSSLDLKSVLTAITPDDIKPLLTDLLERRTIYETRIAEAVAQKSEQGYDVSFVVETRKLYDDGKGQLTPTSFTDAVDIAIYDDQGNELRREKVTMNQESQRVTLRVDSRPTKAAVDPYFLLIDRNLTNNIATITISN
jgi:ABC-2 type transport system permease protein